MIMYWCQVMAQNIPYMQNKVEADSESVDSPIDRFLTSKQNSTSRDQLFVQLDRNVYGLGDTIHFQAYIRDRFTNIFESNSVSMYAVLFNENKIMTDSSRFKISNSTSSGWLAIPVKAEFGKYHFVAFTSLMQNYDPADAFQLDLFVKEANRNPEKIEITYNKKIYDPGDTLQAVIKITDANGKTINKQKLECSLTTENFSVISKDVLTIIKGESSIRFILPDTINYQPRLRISTTNENNKVSVLKDFNIPFNDQYFELRFLPEGGTFVSGLKERIGFNATNFKGEPVQIEGLLKNSSGLILDTIKSGTYGPGYFICTAQPGLYVEIIKGGGAEKKWPLPVPDKEGITLSIQPVNNQSFAVEIQSDTYDNKEAIVSGIMNMTQVFSREIILNKKQRIVVGTDQLPSGVAEITLFNKDFKPISKRLFYVNSDKHLKFNIKTENKIYHPGQDTEITISVADGQGNPAEGIFSIAVTDSIRGHDPELFTPGIEYSFNYHPYFPGNLPPKVLVKGIENLTDEERDLLLMVYGWSRYNWDFNPEKKDDRKLANYDLLNLKILYASRSHLAGRRIELISLEGPSIKHLLTDNSGEISLPLDSLPEITRSVTIMPDVQNKNRVLGTMLSVPSNEQYFRSDKLFIPQPIIKVDEYHNYLPFQNISLGEKLIELPEITITGHPGDKKEYHDKYEELYQYSNIRSLDYELLWSSPTMENGVRRIISPYSITNDNIFLRSTTSLFGGSVPALIVLDGMPIYERGWSLVNTIPPGELTSLTILNSRQAFARYGEAAQGGVIFVNTRSSDPGLMKIHTKWILQNKKDKMLLPISIYRPDIEFYIPTKLDIDFDPMLQSRATIFWESEVYFDGKDPVNIKYTNLKHSGSVLITINGVSFNNLAGTGSASYLAY